MKDTKIEWCDHSWSPWRGCTKVSAGCAHCYAETLSKRNPAVLGQWGNGKPRVLANNWNDPVKWNKHWSFTVQCSKCGWRGDQRKGCGCHYKFHSASRPRVFPSLCDWLDDEVPIELLARFLKLIHDTPNLDWLLLTKRPENWAVQMDTLRRMTGATFECAQRVASEWCSGRTPPNVWVGTSVEDQANTDRRIPELLKIPARLRFLSVEPLLGPVDLSGTRGSNDGMGLCWDWTGNPIHVPHCDYAAVGKAPPNGPSIDWVIVGGESGPGARPCNVEWIGDIVRQCAAAGTACFVKQVGSNPVGPDNGTYVGDPPPTRIVSWKEFISHPKGGDPEEWPEELRVRQMPEVVP